MEVDFDLGSEHDLTTFHFWNYHSEGFDVDQIDLHFFDASMAPVGELLGVSPALGNGTGSDSTPIFAEDFALTVQGARFVNAVLSGSNSQVDFNNMGFTGLIPAPGAAAALAAAGLAGCRRRR